jgi:hypothetical protein
MPRKYALHTSDVFSTIWYICFSFVAVRSWDKAILPSFRLKFTSLTEELKLLLKSWTSY